MGDLRNGKDPETNHDEDSYTVVAFKEEDTGFPKVDGDADRSLENRDTLLQGDFTIQEDGDAASAVSPTNSGTWTDCFSSPARICVRCRGEDYKADTEPPVQRAEKKAACPGLGILYTLVATVFFSVASLLVKKVEGMHAVEISAIRCFFQMLFVIPAMIYYNTGLMGPPGMRVYLFLRGFLGSNAMILLYYAVLQMPLADATVITFSNPVFTSLLAWIFLKERCTIWDAIFTLFTLIGVILIARPPFLFKDELSGIDGNYDNHIMGTVAAFSSAICAACTIVILRKMGKNVHYCLSMWYYAVLGFIECVVVMFIIDEWTMPPCGWDRWILMSIGLLGIGGQTFLTKALQIEKAGPVALMRTADVLLAFILQFLFLNRQPTWWSIGGALCVVSSTTGVALRKWYSSTRQRT